MQLTNLGPLLEKSDLSTFGRGASVYMPTSRRPVYFRSLSACEHVHRPQASLLSGSKHPRTWSPAWSAHVHARRPVYFQARSTRVHWPFFTFVYMPTGRLLVYFRACPCTCRSLNTGVHALQPQACLTSCLTGGPAAKRLVIDIHTIPIPHKCIIDIHTIPVSQNCIT